MKRMRLAILVHGCNLGADSWEDTVWGDRAPQHLGRLTRAVLLYLQFQEVVQHAEVASMVLGTGVLGVDAGKRTSVERQTRPELFFPNDLRTFRCWQSRNLQQSLRTGKGVRTLC